MSANRSVNDILADYVPVSLSLGLVAMTLAVALGIPIGLLAAIRRHSPVDRAALLFAVLGVSVPNFVLTPILIVGLSVWLRWLPPGGWAGIWSPRVIIPAVALAVAPAAGLAGYTRSAMLDVLGADYVRTARAKGVSPVGVIARHAFRNALIPVLTIAGLYLARVVTGSFFVETIAAVPGIGRYFVTSISTRDYPVMLGTTLLLAFVVASVNLIVDLLYAAVDPRIRYR
jgi:ABC-type dipeptide/oligopeptide/nickel transport system permease component